MAARTSMASLILTLRALAAAGTADYTVNGESYWTATQIQEVLDRHAQQIRHEELQPMPTIGLGGTIGYFDYGSPRRFFETTDAGTARFIIQSETGATIGTAAWTADYESGIVTFGTSTAGLARYVTGYVYDLNAAAADIWAQKAAHYVTAYDVSTDNHSLKRSQIIDNCMKMSKEYMKGAAMFHISVDRSDGEGPLADPTIRTGRTHN